MKFLVAIGLLALTFQNLTHARDYRFKERTRQGIRSGTLTKNEVRILKHRNERFNNMKERFASDGELSNKEKARLAQYRSNSSKIVYGLKHNDKNREEKPSAEQSN